MNDEEQPTAEERAEIARLRKKYPYIVKWGRNMQSYDYYIDAQCAEAEVDNAPVNATYKRHDGTWATTDSCTNPNTRERLGLPKLEEKL